MTKFYTNPATGKTETIGHDTPVIEGVKKDMAHEDLQRARRELRDMIGGNTQFHEDPRAAPEAPAEPSPVVGMNEPGIELESGEFVPAAKLNDQERDEFFQHLQQCEPATYYTPQAGAQAKLMGGSGKRAWMYGKLAPFTPYQNAALKEMQQQLVSQMVENAFAASEEQARNDLRALAVEAGFVRDAAGKLFASNTGGWDEVPLDAALIKFATLVLQRRDRIGVDPGAPGGDKTTYWRYSK